MKSGRSDPRQILLRQYLPGIFCFSVQAEKLHGMLPILRRVYQTNPMQGNIFYKMWDLAEKQEPYAG